MTGVLKKINLKMCKPSTVQKTNAGNILGQNMCNLYWIVEHLQGKVMMSSKK